MSINKYNYNDCRGNLEIGHIKPEDSKQIQILAKVYEESFSDHFLGHMGRKFLELFISEFVNTPGNYGYVAKFRGEPIGFV